jgi:hypothetical protein
MHTNPTEQGQQPAQHVAAEPAEGGGINFDEIATRMAGEEPPRADNAGSDDSGSVENEQRTGQPAQAQEEPQGTKPEAAQQPEQGVEPPAHWRSEDKEAFNQLPPEARKLVLERDRILEGLHGRRAEQQRQQLAAWDTLIQRIQQDQGFAQHVFGYDQPKPQQPEQAEQPPADPIERMKWEAKQEAKRELEQMLNPQLEQMRSQFEQAQQAQAIQRVQAHVAADPMYRDVQAAIVEQLQALPEAMGRDLYARLDSDPQAYMEMYSRTRESLARTPQQPQAAPPRGADGKFVQQEQPQRPAPTRRETKTPQLESSGQSGGSGSNQKLDAVRDRIRSGQAQSGDLEALLVGSGVIDRITG